jgi:hypothetical protein
MTAVNPAQVRLLGNFLRDVQDRERANKDRVVRHLVHLSVHELWVYSCDHPEAVRVEGLHGVASEISGGA